MRPALPLALTGLAALSLAQEPLEFGARVDAVHLDVFVSRDGEPVVGLSADDFEVRDNGERRTVEIAQSSEAAPLHVVLVLDTSSSVAGARLDDLKAAAAAFLGGLGASDRATLTSFSHRARLHPPVEADPASVQLLSLRARGGTALFDAVYSGLQLANATVERRPMVLVFSDGEDGLSWLSAEDVELAARQSSAVVFAIHSSRIPVPSDGRRLADLERRLDPTARFLRAVAEDSGGRLWQTHESDLASAFRRVLAELQSHYLIRFSPPRGECREWHELGVKLRGRKGRVRARRGYSAVCESG